MQILRNIKAGFLKVKKGWQNRMSTRTKRAVGILSVPGAVAKVAAVIGAGASVLHIIGPYLIGWAAVSTLTMATLVTIDVIKSKRRREWTNAAGQVVESTLLEKQELNHAQKKFDKLSRRVEHDGHTHKGEAIKLATHFKKYADRAVVKQDVPEGQGRFRYVFGKTVFGV